MTIITAKPAAVRQAGLRPGPLAVALALAAWSVAPASYADWKFTPVVTLSETYTDNVLLQPAGQERSQFISELTPSFALSHLGPRLDFSLNYGKNLRRYSNQDVGGTVGNQQQLSSRARLKVYEDLLLLDASATISRQPNSAFGPQALPGRNGTGFAESLSSEVKTLRIAPSLHHRFGSWARVDALYNHDSVLSDNRGLGQYNSDSANVTLSSGPAFHQLGWNLGYQASRIDNKEALQSNLSPQTNIKSLSASLQYLLQPGLRLLVNAGHDSYDYEALPGTDKPSGKSWSLGASWTPSGRTSVQATAGKRYFGDSYSLLASHRRRASVWTLSYNDTVTTTQSQFLQSGAVATSTFLDQLFAGTIADPALRARVVDAYIRANNLPPSLANTTNYFSNRFMLVKELQASAAWVGSRGTLLVSLTDSRREGLSALRIDSDLLGSVNNRLNDNTHQSGVSSSLSWRLSSRTSANAGVSYTRTRSLTVNRTDNTRAMRLNLSHEFARKVNGSVELRRARGSALAGDGRYTENALSASLSKQF